MTSMLSLSNELYLDMSRIVNVFMNHLAEGLLCAQHYTRRCVGCKEEFSGEQQ